MYQEQVPSYKHLDEPLDEGRFVFECISAGNLQVFATYYYSDCELYSHMTGNNVSDGSEKNVESGEQC